MMQDVKPYPLIFEPLIKSKVWGGRALQTLLNKPLPPDGPVGESWEIVDLRGHQSVAARGAATGVTLEGLVRTWGEGLMGPAALDQGRFPLLVKYIDAAQTLSVQVHPNAEVGARLGGRSKSEAWYIMDAEPGGVVYHGLRQGTTAADLSAALDAGRVQELLHRVKVWPGDLVPVPPGTVHAIGAGVLLAEVQQPSDTTYRVYDWGRLGLDNKPRQLHIDQAQQSINFGPPPAIVRHGEVDMGYFSFRLAELAPAEVMALDQPGPRVVVGLEGLCAVEVAGHRPLTCQRGDAALVPHACRPAQVISVDGGKVLAVSFPAG